MESVISEKNEFVSPNELGPGLDSTSPCWLSRALDRNKINSMLENRKSERNAIKAIYLIPTAEIRQRLHSYLRTMLHTIHNYIISLLHYSMGVCVLRKLWCITIPQWMNYLLKITLWYITYWTSNHSLVLSNYSLICRFSFQLADECTRNMNPSLINSLKTLN